MNDGRGVSQVSMKQVRSTFKRRDAWWTVLLVDPVAGRLVRAGAGVPWITPARLTGTAFLLGIAAAGALLQATPGWLAIGAVLYYASFLVDCTDGKIARLHGRSSIVGSWLDFLLDRLRVIICTVALFGGQFLHTGNAGFLLAATGVTFLAMFGYLNGAETERAKVRMARLAPAPSGSPQSGPPQINGQPVALPPVARRIRALLHRHRIRMNLVSGVEFEMAVLVLAPLVAAATGPAAILWVTGVAAALLVGFELALMARFWLIARSFDRTTDRTRVPTPRPERPGADQRPHPVA